MKILITGATGFVGHHLARGLLNDGHQVIGIGAHGERPVPDIEIWHLDLMDATKTAELDLEDVEGIIHLAGLAAVGPSFEQPLRYIATNAGIQINLLEACLGQNIQPRVLVISTGGLYDSSAKLPLTETSRVLPSSPYAVSKLTQENLTDYYGRRGFEVMIARPFNHIGPGQSQGFLLPDLAKQVVEAEMGRLDKIKVGNLEAKRDYTDVRDIANAYRLLIEKGEAGQTYNVCSGRSVSGQGILDKLMELAGKGVAIETDSTLLRPSDAADLYGSHDKLTKATGWKPQIELDQTIGDVLADWRQRLT